MLQRDHSSAISVPSSVKPSPLKQFMLCYLAPMSSCTKCTTLGIRGLNTDKTFTKYFDTSSI